MASNRSIDAAEYLEWIGFGGTPQADLATLTELQRLHMTAVPFENVDIAFGSGVPLDVDAAVAKIVEHGRGGWCFEVNGAFSELLRAIGFDVILLGAAVLLDGPTEMIDHLTLEVRCPADRSGPFLVDVGFGECFIRPLDLNRSGPQDGGDGTYELIRSPQGTTLTKHDADGVPVAQYRFKRVAHTIDQFAGVSASLQVDDDKNWKKKAFATRLLDGGPDRVTLTHDRLKVTRDGETTRRTITAEHWSDTLHAWFGFHAPG